MDDGHFDRWADRETYRHTDGWMDGCKALCNVLINCKNTFYIYSLLNPAPNFIALFNRERQSISNKNNHHKLEFQFLFSKNSITRHKISGLRFSVNFNSGTLRYQYKIIQGYIFFKVQKNSLWLDRRYSFSFQLFSL